MRAWKSSAVLLALIVVILAACGGGEDGAGDSDTTTTTGQADDEAAPDTAAATTTEAGGSGDEGGGAAPAVTEMGRFTVNDTEFAVTFLNRCIPFDGADSEDIDLQPVAQGQGALLNLYGTADSVEVSVQGSTVEEIGGTNSFAADPFGDGEIRASSIDGDRWTGEATLADSYGSDSTVEVTWDVMIPDEIRDCSL